MALPSALALATIFLTADAGLAQQPQAAGFGEYGRYVKPAYDGWIRSSQYVPMRDATRLAVDILRPTRAGQLHSERLPVIWTHMRYQRATLAADGSLTTILHLNPALVSVLKQGYVVAIADVRGSGASFGTNYGWFPPQEARDAYDLIEWFARQPWSNGNVGMYGLSYLGITQYFAASEAPPHLKAIFPEVAWLDAYNFPYPGGIFLDWVVFNWGTGVLAADRVNPLPLNWPDIVRQGRVVRPAEAAAVEANQYICQRWGCGRFFGDIPPVDEDADGRLLAEATAQHKANGHAFVIASKLPYRNSVDDVTRTPIHLERSLYPRLKEIGQSGVAIYHLGGWFDGFTRETFLWFRNTPGNPQKLVMGPWTHVSYDGPLHASEYLRWFDYWLKGIQNGVMDEDPIHYFTMGAPEGQQWRSARQWPLPNERPTAFYFHPGPSGSIQSVNDGRLSTERPTSATGQDDYTVDYTTTVGLENRWTWTAGGSRGGPLDYPDLAPNDRKGLTYTTAPLTEDLEVTGHPVVHLWVSTSAKEADFFVYLEEVRPDGFSDYVTEGQLRASHRKLGEAPYDNLGLPYHRSYAEDVAELPAGQPVELVFDLHPTSKLFRAGNRLRVTLTGADQDTFATPVQSPPPRLSLLRNATHASHIVLPVIPR